MTPSYVPAMPLPDAPPSTAVWTDAVRREAGLHRSVSRSEPARTRCCQPRCRSCPRLLCREKHQHIYIPISTCYAGLSGAGPGMPAMTPHLCPLGSIHSFQGRRRYRIRGRPRWHSAALTWTPDGLSASCCGRLRWCPGSNMQPAASNRKLTAPESHPCCLYVP